MTFDIQEALTDLHQRGGLNTLLTHNAHPSREIKDTTKWPKPDSAMFYGLPGEIVRAIEPHTEADSVAILIQILTAFGNIIGRSAYFEVEADRHYPNLFIALVGETAKGRKGVSWGHAARLLKTLEPEWSERITSGLSSGEGILYAVRDQQDGDSGVEDKRLQVVEPELASVLRVIGRDGNTLSAIIRQAWDSGTMRTMTKNSPLKATNAHISIISHVTKPELLKYLTSTESGNGFANRFLWLCVRRSKCLPRGGDIQSVHFDPFLKELSKSIEFAQNAGRIEPTEAAWCIWDKVYPELSEGVPGLLGAVTSRAEAQVLRLAMIYALLDQSFSIKPSHLLAALSLWDYSFDSAKYIFGDSLGDPVADIILDALRENSEGLTRTEIYNSFGRHGKSADIQRALKSLHIRGLVFKTERPTGGRSVEIWTAQEAHKGGEGL